MKAPSASGCPAAPCECGAPGRQWRRWRPGPRSSRRRSPWRHAGSSSPTRSAPPAAGEHASTPAGLHWCQGKTLFGMTWCGPMHDSSASHLFGHCFASTVSCGSSTGFWSLTATLSGGLLASVVDAARCCHWEPTPGRSGSRAASLPAAPGAAGEAL